MFTRSLSTHCNISCSQAQKLLPSLLSFCAIVSTVPVFALVPVKTVVVDGTAYFAQAVEHLKYTFRISIAFIERIHEAGLMFLVCLTFPRTGNVAGPSRIISAAAGTTAGFTGARGSSRIAVLIPAVSVQGAAVLTEWVLGCATDVFPGGCLLELPAV